MSPKNFHRLFAAALLTLPPGGGRCGRSRGQVTAEAASQVKAFKRTSVIVADVLIYDTRNWMVYGGTEQERTPRLMAKACLPEEAPAPKAKSSGG